MTYITDKFDSEVLRQLRTGGVGFMPSDTIYGLSAAAFDEQAVAKLHSIKGRADKPFIVLFSDIKMLNMLSISKEQMAPVQKYWPGGLTLICDAPNSPKWLHRDLRTVAIRMPDNQKLLKLVDKVGPIVSTSANPEGVSPAENLTQAIQYFGDKLDFYVDAGKISGFSSTIVKVKNGRLDVIRPGAVKIKGE